MKWIKISAIFIMLFFILSFFLSLIFKDQVNDFLTERTRNYGLIGLFLGSFILEMLPQYIAPQLFAFNAALWGLSFTKSVFSLYMGSVFGSIIGFEIGRRYKEKHLDQIINKKIKKKIKKLIKKWGNFGLFLTAISPLPYIPMVFGALLPIKRSNFIIFGILPRFIYFFYIALFAYYVF